MVIEPRWIQVRQPGHFDSLKSEHTGAGWIYDSDYTAGPKTIEVHGAVTFRPFGSEAEGGPWCYWGGPPSTYTWSVSGKTLTLNLGKATEYRVYVTTSDRPNDPLPVARNDLETALGTLNDFRARDLVGLTSDVGDTFVQVYFLPAKATGLARAHPGVGEQRDDGLPAHRHVLDERRHLIEVESLRLTPEQSTFWGV